jgi:hypothetical protein
MLTGISLEAAIAMQVKVENGEVIKSSRWVDKLEWWAQGHNPRRTRLS